MKFAFLDDNSAFLETVKKAVTDYSNETEITYFTIPDKFIDFVKVNSNSLDGVFIDIVLDDTNGMEIAKNIHEINSDIKIVFVTGYVKEYCQNIFLSNSDVTPFAFLTKPLENDILFKILDKFSEVDKSITEKDLLIKTTNGYIYIKPSEICYLESQKRMVKFSLKNKLIHETYGKITDYSEQLTGFSYSHKSYLVNLNCIKQFNTNEAIMINEEKIPISQRYQKQFKDEILLNRGKRQTSEVL